MERIHNLISVGLVKECLKGVSIKLDKLNDEELEACAVLMLHCCLNGPVGVNKVTEFPRGYRGSIKGLIGVPGISNNSWTEACRSFAEWLEGTMSSSLEHCQQVRLHSRIWPLYEEKWTSRSGRSGKKALKKTRWLQRGESNFSWKQEPANSSIEVYLRKNTDYYVLTGENEVRDFMVMMKTQGRRINVKNLPWSNVCWEKDVDKTYLYEHIDMGFEFVEPESVQLTAHEICQNAFIEKVKQIEEYVFKNKAAINIFVKAYVLSRFTSITLSYDGHNAYTFFVFFTSLGLLLMNCCHWEFS
jgi:hypothetical protein